MTSISSKQSGGVSPSTFAQQNAVGPTVPPSASQPQVQASQRQNQSQIIGLMGQKQVNQQDLQGFMPNSIPIQGKSQHFVNQQKIKEKRLANQRAKGVSVGGPAQVMVNDGSLILLQGAQKKATGVSSDRVQAQMPNSGRGSTNFQTALPVKNSSRQKPFESKTKTIQYQINNQLHNVSDLSQQRIQYLPTNSAQQMGSYQGQYENKNQINAISIQKNFITSKRDSRDSAIITTQSLGAGMNRSKQSQDQASQKAPGQQNVQFQLIQKPASISIQHPQHLGNPTMAVANPNRMSHEDAKKSLLLEQLSGGITGARARKGGDEVLRKSAENEKAKQRTPVQQSNFIGQMNFLGSQISTLQAQSAQMMPMQLGNLVPKIVTKGADTRQNEPLAGPSLSPKVSNHKHVSLSPVRGAGHVARDVIAAANSSANNGGSYRQRLMTEHSNLRDSSQDQINSIKDFAVSQGMASQHSNAISHAKKSKMTNQKKPNSAAQPSGKPASGNPLNSNRTQQQAINNVLRNSTNSFKGSYKQLHKQNQAKIDLMFQQNASHLQKANAKLNQHGDGVNERHKKTKSMGVPVGLHAKNNVLLRQIPHKQTKKTDNIHRKSARSTSNNNQQASQQGISQNQLVPDQGKVYQNQQPRNSVDSQGKGMGRITQRVVANMATAARHASSRSNKNIQKFQTHFPSAFNGGAKGMQYYNESHGQSAVSIGNSAGSNSALDKLERQTANFGQPLGDRSTKPKAQNANHKPEHAQAARAGPKSSKVKLTGGASATGNAASQPQQKQQANAALKGRVKTEISQNKNTGGGALHQRELSSENLLKYKEQVKQYKYQSVIKRPVQRQAQSHKISPKARGGQITIPMVSDDQASRKNLNKQPHPQQNKGRTPNSNALMHVPTQSTPGQSGREAGYTSSQVRIPTTSSKPQKQIMNEQSATIGNSNKSLQQAIPTQQKAQENQLECSVEDLIADLQEIKLPQQKQSNRPQPAPYTSQGLSKDKKKLINNFIQEDLDMNDQDKVGELSENKDVSEQEAKKQEPTREKKLIHQILQNYHNLDAQAQNYLLKLFVQKTKQEPDQDEAQVQNYFDISLNQSGSATTFKQSELVHEHPFDSHRKPSKDEGAKDSPFKKRVQAKQVDFMHKGLKQTNQIAVRKHRSRQNQSDPVSPSGRNSEALLVKDLVETVQSEDKEDRQNTIVVDLGVINKSIKDMDKQTESSKAEQKQQQKKAAEPSDANAHRPSSANSDDVVLVGPDSKRGDQQKNLHQSLHTTNELNQSKSAINESKDALTEQEAMDKFYIPKNVVTKYAFATRVGYIPMNPSKVNQDTYILGPCIEGPENNSKHMFGVNDGHGQFGHHASGFIKEALLEIVKELIEKDKNNQPKDQSMIAKEYEDLFQSAFLKCDQRLSDASEKSREQESEIDFFDLRLSGSTVCTVFFDGTSVHCANAGDSRAIKVKLAYDENDKLQTVCEALSEDHKPDLAAEKARILGMGGRIDTFHDTQNNNEPIGPYRVWLKHEELPGLAMSRSLGDKIAHSVGVSSLPEVKSTFLGVDDKFIVIGSDGVWEFLSNEQIAEIVLPFYQMNQPEAAANAIVKEAYKAWRENEEVVDDITTVVIFVEPYMAYRQVDLESKLEKNVDKGARNHFVQKSNSQPNVAAAGLSK